MKKHRGFTLIEFIVVIVIVGIISVSVVTKLLGTSEFSTYSVRDQLISELRLAQLRALNQRDACFSVQVSSVDMGIYQVASINGVCGLNYTSTNTKTELSSGVTVTIGGVANTTLTRDIRFDSSGRPSGGNCSAGNLCTLTITGSDALSLCIESEGYIHGC